MPLTFTFFSYIKDEVEDALSEHDEARNRYRLGSTFCENDCFTITNFLVDANLSVTNFLIKDDDESNLDITTLSLQNNNEAERRLLVDLCSR